MSYWDDKGRDENCGHCSWHRKQNDEWVCTNPDADEYGDYTEYRDTCDMFEERQTRHQKFSVEITRSKKS